ncbi:hypothetical protein HG536_0A06450 [Torulaspora globosa]|uniref:FAS1 domain-containing protein n=1 Tax=Torulaspora globosa TaxID=48254 RepID=A0A7G3ZBE4_9SACH|nr:uncharacterized protein HG536_0A06450 [Torulaspora globosa]QLL30830.1 hypothetical protein HG536_0A06450 [Torulaspora globosa]
MFGSTRLLLSFSVILSLRFVLLLGLTEAKNIVGIENFHDESGRLHRRFSSDDSILQARDAKRLPLDIDKVMEENSRLFKRDPKRLPLDINAIIEEEERIAKRDQMRSQKDFSAGSKNLHIAPVSLDSKLTSMKETAVFFSYIRDDVQLSAKLCDENEDLIIIAPSNDAISKLSKKPWGFPRDVASLEASEATEREIDSAIRRNILQFVRSHVVAYDESHSLDEYGPGCITLKSLEFENSSNQDTKGDILLKKQGDSFYAASVVSKDFHKVQKVETAVNGVVLVIDSCLEKP